MTSKPARLALLALGLAFAADGPTPLTADEKYQLLLVQTKLEQARGMRRDLAEQRDKYVEAKIRQAIEEWYQSPDGQKYGMMVANVDALQKAVNQHVESLRKTHNAAGHDFDGDGLNWKPVAPATAGGK